MGSSTKSCTANPPWSEWDLLGGNKGTGFGEEVGCRLNCSRREKGSVFMPRFAGANAHLGPRLSSLPALACHLQRPMKNREDPFVWAVCIPRLMNGIHHSRTSHIPPMLTKGPFSWQNGGVYGCLGTKTLDKHLGKLI